MSVSVRYARPPSAGASVGFQSANNSLHAAAVEQIGSWIVQGRFLPGEVLPNADDSKDMIGVSRSVLREAIKVLAGKGLVESRPKTGTRVRPRSDWNFLDPDVLSWRYSGAINPDDVRALFELRRAIEPMSAMLAAQRATPEQIAELEAALVEMEEFGDDGDRFAEPDLVFHQTILRMTGNELMGSLAALIETALVMSFRLSNDNPQGQRPSLPLHREVARKIAAGDAVGAHQAILVLLDHAEEDVRRGVESRNLRRGSQEPKP
ncbi:MAG: FadR family transcriptional regulator [Rhizobiaceae bacterium]|nr:FadR family transcriptional regulator [Rhizobiaceae bacterium]